MRFKTFTSAIPTQNLSHLSDPKSITKTKHWQKRIIRSLVLLICCATKRQNRHLLPVCCALLDA